MGHGAVVVVKVRPNAPHHVQFKNVYICGRIMCDKTCCVTKHELYVYVLLTWGQGCGLRVLGLGVGRVELGEGLGFGMVTVLGLGLGLASSMGWRG